MTRSLDDGYTSPLYPPRQLNDDVLQTAEEAVLTHPASVEAIPSQADVYGTASAVSRYRGALLGYVAEKPCRSALMAVVAGAVVAAALRSALAHRSLPRFWRSA